MGMKRRFEGGDGYSLYSFAKEICGFKDFTPRLHREICDRLESNLTQRKRSSAIIIPRDHFKSSMSLAAVLWMFTRELAARNYEYRVLIDTSTLGLAKKHIRWIRAVMKSKKYRERFGDFVKKSIASDQGREFFINKRQDGGIHKEPNFMANSVTAETTGNHFDLIWFDDLVSEQNYRTPDQRQKVIEHYINSTNLLEPDGLKIYNGTPWHDGDLTGYLMKKASEDADSGKRSEFDWYYRGCFGEPGDQEGEPIFPERWNTQLLLDKKQGTTSRNWACQWLCDPVLPEESIPFNRSTMYLPREAIPPLRMKIVTVDPNFRQGDQIRGDYGVFCVGGFDRFMNWYCLDLQIGKYDAAQFIEKMFSLQNMWQPNAFRVEKKGVSFLDHALKQEMIARQRLLNIHYIPRDGRSKDTRYACLQPMFSANRMHFASEIPEESKRELEDELERAGSSAHDDILDALADQIEGINPVTPDTETVFHGEQPFPFPNAPTTTTSGAPIRNWGGLMMPAEYGLDDSEPN